MYLLQEKFVHMQCSGNENLLLLIIYVTSYYCHFFGDWGSQSKLRLSGRGRHPAAARGPA